MPALAAKRLQDRADDDDRRDGVEKAADDQEHAGA